ncbi:hypothetical protein OHS32_25350 [Micromonospora chokoriensis]
MGYSVLRRRAAAPAARDLVVPAGAWWRREPVLHNVLPTLVTDRLSGEVPLSGDERFVPAAVRSQPSPARPGPARPGPARQDRARSGM